MSERPVRGADVGRALSRVALAAVFVTGGSQVWRRPDGPAQAASSLLGRCRSAVPRLDRFTDRQLVRANAALHMTAGAALAVGAAPRACAAALAGSLVPTTLAAFPFWKEPPGPQRVHRQGDFLKNVALAGGLLASALTGGRTGQAPATPPPTEWTTP
ncbi:DoxX family membrane protein [Streptomyces sp. NPDC005480]|uniref:DoxX family membrane protein n=1 Tax=Streptomyces sp. NPDC005480 TaxID=3154880 RepID=UPI0033AC006D